MKGKKNAPTPGDGTVSMGEVVGKFKALIRDRDSSGQGGGHAVITKRHDQVLTAGNENHITVVQSDNKNRKRNTSRVRSSVQAASMSHLQNLVKDVQTFVIDLPGDSVLEKIRDMSLSAEDEWRELTQKSHTGEIRSRLQNLYEELVEYKGIQKAQRRPRHVILYNSRSGSTFLYDVAFST